MWKDGVFKGLTWSAKIFNEGSECGINGGRVSKLWVSNGGEIGNRKVYLNYDRGWDIEPETEELKQWLDEFLQYVDENIPMYEVEEDNL